MATAIMAGIAVYGGLAGTVIGGVTISAAAAAAVGVAAAGAMMIMEEQMKPDAPDQQAAVSLGSSGTPIDKTKMQEEAEVGKLKLGEDDKKAKRKKGKAAFKIELDKKEAAGDAGDTTGVQVAKPKDLGVQL